MFKRFISGLLLVALMAGISPIQIAIAEDDPQVVTVTVQQTLTLSVATSTLGALTPGAAVSATSTATVSTNSLTGWNLKIKRDSATSTVTLTTDRDTGIPDFTAWDPTATGNAGNATSTLADVAAKFSFHVQNTETTAAMYSTTWWGANDTDGTAKYAGMPTASQTIATRADYAGTAQKVEYKLRVDAPATQKSGAYDGTLTMTALVNP
ncbi:MAG: hypothetical protein UX66_C0001G0026 [Parcubacteria group bacterium GW2011_GWF2_46_8]|nr:MAG: hypothetical protein UX66_C0001G0026 [Parcubacteria group bacterium GW2011_GWF2_46_8]